VNVGTADAGGFDGYENLIGRRRLRFGNLLHPKIADAMKPDGLHRCPLRISTRIQIDAR
jgi:hypothetical protein